jgi:UDP-N-acetylglucosamine 2-epimerase
MYVVGTRPEFIRSAYTLRALSSRGDLDLSLLHTGQHWDANMSSGFFDRLELPAPRHHLGCGGGTRIEQIICVANGTAMRIHDDTPDCVCVFGDTNSSLGGALGAVASGIPVVHIEAGARCHDMSLPEEVNRRLIDHCSDLLLAVSANCVDNLRREAVPGKVANTGDPLFEVFVDAIASLPSRTDKALPTCLMTLHRQGLVEEPGALGIVLASVSQFAVDENVRVVFPVHPRTRRALQRDRLEKIPGISFCEPLLYHEFALELRDSSLVITDSGGLQKEAYWLGKPCVTVRSSTEWTETTTVGANVLALGDDVGKAARRMLHTPLDAPSEDRDPYHGRGASTRVLAALVDRYGP